MESYTFDYLYFLSFQNTHFLKFPPWCTCSKFSISINFMFNGTFTKICTEHLLHTRHWVSTLEDKRCARSNPCPRGNLKSGSLKKGGEHSYWWWQYADFAYLGWVFKRATIICWGNVSKCYWRIYMCPCLWPCISFPTSRGICLFTISPCICLYAFFKWSVCALVHIKAIMYNIHSLSFIFFKKVIKNFPQTLGVISCKVNS